jgi:hypothetical protein
MAFTARNVKLIDTAGSALQIGTVWSDQVSGCEFILEK